VCRTETADVTGQETGPVTVNQLAREEQKRAGWSEAWPFIPADLGNSDFRQLLRDDPNISPEEKVQIFEAGYKLGVVPRQEVADVIDLGGPVDLTANIPDVKLGQFSPGSTATTTIERDGKTTTTTIPARAVPLTTDLSNTELTRTIERRMDELDAAGEGTPEAAIIQDEISALQKEQRRREAARPVTEKTSKAQRDLFEDEGEGDVGGEPAAKPSQTIEDILKSLGPEVQARYEAAAAEAERQRAERRGRGRPALTAEGTAERAAQEKARKRAIADNTRDTAIVKRFTERFKKLYKDDDGGLRDTFASMVEVFGKEARSKIAARVNALKEKEAALITQMYFAYNSMPDSAHRRRLGQLLYSIDENTGRRDKPNPLISPDAFSRAERVFKETREEARQAAAERRTHTLLSKARSLGKKEAEGKNRQVDTINGEFNNVTTVKDALKIVAKTGTPFMKLLAKRISNAVGDAKFIVVERGDKLPKALEKDSSAVGITAIEKDAAGNLKVTVYVRGASWGDRSQGINNIIVLHEALHAALDKKVWGIKRANKLGLTTTKAERDFYDDIAALMAEARDRFGYMYIYYKRSNNLDPIQTGNKLLYKALEEVVEGAKGAMFNDPQEFIAYALSEPVFENFLNGYKPANSIRSAYGKFVDLVRKLFGFAPNQITALTELVSAVDAGISTKSSRGVVEALQLSLMSPSAAKRAMKSKSDMLKLAKEQESVAKGYEESDDPTKVNGSIEKSIYAQSGKDAVEAITTLYATGSTKTKRALVRVFTLPLLGDVARRLGLKSVAEAPALFSKMNSLADNILLGAQETLDNTFRTFQGRPKAMAAFTRLALQSTLLNIDPATNLSSPMLNKLYAALDEKGKQEYIRMRDYFQGMTQMYTRFLDDRVKNLGVSEQEADNVLEKIKAMYEVGDKIYPFFPLKRFGDYWIRIGVGANRKFFTFESEFERDQAVRKFAKKRNMTVNEFLSQKEGTEQYARVGIKLDELRGELLTGEMGQKLRELFDAIDKMDAADPDAKAKLKDDIYQTYLATLPEQSIRRQFMHREGITGYSTDFLRSFTEAATQNAFQLSRIKYGPELRRAVSAARKATTNQPALATLAEEFSRRVNNNLTTGKSENKLLDWTTSFLTQSSFIYYLSAVASPMLQMFQLGITGFNTLGANYGFAKTTKEIAKLSKVWNQFSVFKKNADGSVTMTAPSLARSKAVQMNDRERRAMEKLLRHDVVRVTLAAEVTELSKIPSKSLEGSFSQSARSIMQLPGKLMQAVEQLAREMLALIAYRLAYEKHGDNETAIEEAAFHVADSMGNYASYARPPFMQGALGRLAFQFMMFPVQMTGWFAKNFYFSIPFLKTNKEGKHLAFKLWASSLASIWVVAGTSGLPFGLGTMMLGVLSQLFDEAKDDDDFPPEYKDMAFEFYVRKVWLPQQVGHITINDVPLDMIIDYGPLSAFTGVDFASRLSLSNMFIRERKEEATFESELTNRLIGMGGPSLNMIINFVKGLDALRVGDVQKFGEKVAPAALRAPLFAEKYSRQGVVDWEGTVLTPADQVELGKLLAQAIGFRPLELTEQGYRTFTQRAVEQAIQYEKNRIYTRLYRALVTGDSKEFDRIRIEDIKEFNKKHKKFRIEEDDVKRSLRERLEQREIKQKTRGFGLNERNAPLIVPLLRQDR
jgi:hypothetical protein